VRLPDGHFAMARLYFLLKIGTNFDFLITMAESKKILGAPSCRLLVETLPIVRFVISVSTKINDFLFLVFFVSILKCLCQRNVLAQKQKMKPVRKNCKMKNLICLMMCLNVGIPKEFHVLEITNLSTSCNSIIRAFT